MINIKKTRSITFSFMLAFTIVTSFILIISGVIVYQYQNIEHNNNVMKQMKVICKMLSDGIKEDEENFLSFEKYMMDHNQEVIIDPNFDQQAYMHDRIAFYKAFSEQYPNMSYGQQIKFDDMSDELKMLYVKWYQEFWILRFEDTVKSFKAPYMYFVYPMDDNSHVIYIIDFERAEDENYTDGRMLLWDNYEEDPNEIPVMFEVWKEGRELDKFETCNNEYGYNYSYYIPIYLKGEKAGMVCIDQNIEAVNKTILMSTIQVMALISAIIIISMMILVIYIKKNYIERLTKLNSYIEEYSRDKDANIAAEIQRDIKNEDEIDSLYWRIVSMIEQIQSHLSEIINISQTLGTTQEQVQKLKELSEKDTLTGLGNKLAYTKEEMTLNNRIADSDTDFAIVMIDLNFLKLINDTYGHDKGDVALKRTADYIRQAFPDYKAYRIGGDEFIVVADTTQQILGITECLERLNNIQTDDKSTNAWEHISIASGYSIYSPDVDNDTSSVFKRADEIMYENKVRMKADRKK